MPTTSPVRGRARVMLHAALSTVFPAPCFACGASLPPAQHLGACTTCWASIAAARGPSCPVCAEPVAVPGEICRRCSVRPPPFAASVAAVVYDDVARRFLLRAKNSGRRELLVPFGEQLARAVLLAGLAADADAIVPVPSHPWRWLRRGFDPALDLARAVANVTGLAVRRPLRRRLGATARVKRLGARDRRRAVEDAFVAVGSEKVRGATLLLVDDVFTSGATAGACTRALLRAGAAEVRLAAWARTPKATDGIIPPFGPTVPGLETGRTP